MTRLVKTVRRTTDARRHEKSGRILASGRDIQRRYDIRILRARIATLRVDKNNLSAILIADELEEMARQITLATR